MAHNLSWIDPQTLRSLVAQTAYRRLEPEQAAPPSPARPVAVAPSTSDPPSVEPARTEPAPMPTVPPLRTAGSVRRATRPSLPDPDASRSVPDAPPVRASMLDPFAVAPGALEARLEQLMVWACTVTGLARVFIADDEGLLVASLNAGANAPDEAASVVELCTRGVPHDVGGSEAGSISMVGLERTHVVAWSTGSHGKTFIALSGTVEPSPEALSILCRALTDALR